MSIENWIVENGIENIECILPDMSGCARGKFIDVSQFTAGSIKIAESVLLQTVTGNYCEDHEEFVNPRDGDIVLKPVTDSIRLSPWAKRKTAQLIYDCYQEDGTPCINSSRTILKTVLKQYEAMGLEVIIAPEVEFYLVDKFSDSSKPLQPPVGKSGRRDNTCQSFGIDAVYNFEPILDTMQDYCKKQNLDLTSFSHECGSGQLESNFHHGEPLDLADQVFCFKRTMKQAALKHDMLATFMAKPMVGKSGSSMHIHQSLLNKSTGKNVFCNDDGSKSEMFYHFLGGLQKYTPSLIAFYAPNVNSYRRYTKYINAPTNLHWGYDNRTVGFRIPEAPPIATRIENRFAGIDVNPYLAIAVSLASGLAGIKNKIAPTEEFTGNAFKQPSAIPRSLETSVKALEELHDLYDIIPEQFFKAYGCVKLAELAEFNSVISPWELEVLAQNI